MKTLITIFVLLFSFLVVAEDISNFQIEGIGLRDSLLKRFSKDYILNNSNDYFGTELLTFDPPDTEYKSESVYDSLQAGYNKNDSEFTVHQIAGVIYYDTISKNIDKCLEKKDQIEKEISTLLNIKFYEGTISDEEGKFYGSVKVFENADEIRLYCTDWFKKTENEKGWSDNLRLEFISNEYFKLTGESD